VGAVGGPLRALGLLGAILALVVVVRLAAVLPAVPNRHALTYDAARRAMVDMDAADALRRFDLARLAWDVAGPEQWPTLRLLVAAPVHALAGPSRALQVELGVSVALVGLLVLALALSAVLLSSTTGEAIALFTVSAALLVGNRDLLEHAANGMLEVPEAVCTLGATVAWVRARERGEGRPWSVALLGNALFHAKFQQGLFFAAAVLGTELLGRGWRERCLPVLRALGRGLRTPWVLAVLVLGLGITLLSAALVHSGGGHALLLGQAVSLARPRVVRWCATLTVVATVVLSLASDRARLRLALPPRVRFAWTWLLCPMLVWLLLPFTWRLETLVASATFDAGVGALEPADRWLFYLRAAWHGWFHGGGRWIALALLGCTVLGALRSARMRAQLVPIAAVLVLELAVLTALGGRNLQPRFAVNLAPLVAVGLALWTTAVPGARWHVLTAVVSVALLACGLPLWREAPLEAALGRGFESRENGDACREVARALPLQSGELVNETHPSRLQTCSFWVKALARERGASVRVREPWLGPEPHTVLLLTDGTQPAGARDGWSALGTPARHGAVVGALFLVDRGGNASRAHP